MTIPTCVIRQKRRACDIFGGGFVDDAQDNKWKQLKADIKERNEYARIEEHAAGTRTVDGEVIPDIDQKMMMKALTSGTPSSQLMLMGPSDPAMGPAAGPSAESGQAESASSNAELNLSVYKDHNNQLISADNPNHRLRAMEKPQWQRPWKLHKVISGHQGWVRCVAVDPVSNEWFVTSGEDRLIKFWDLASGTLKLSLTGHSSTVRCLEVSPKYPYLFSGGEDNEVKCWDLETNKVIRNYHGHLNACYTLALHPTLDVLATGGRDCALRVWDMRTKAQIFAMTGHTSSIAVVKSQAAEPQFITGAHDSQVRLWDLAAGKCMTTLTNHHKGIRSVAIHPSEYTFVSSSSDHNKVWKCPMGKFERDMDGHNGEILNCSQIRDNGDGSSIFVAGGDNGWLHFWDWKSGYKFQSIEGKPQPGSLSSENAIFAMSFDKSQTRLITGECDKTVKIYKEDMSATEKTHPIPGNWRALISKPKKR